MALTTDPNDPGLKVKRADGQNAAYLILSDEERSKGFVRPVRTAYKHITCGAVTTMPQAIGETYARQPDFYGSTYCAGCRTHLPLVLTLDNKPVRQFFWTDEKGKPTGGYVGE